METTPAIQDYLGAIYDLAGSDKPVSAFATSV